MDLINNRDILNLTSTVKEELNSIDLDMIDPYVETKNNKVGITFKEKAREIVEQDLSLLKTADIVLMDCSIPNRNYIGCICELVYAYLWGIPIIVYVGSSGNDNRYWLRYHANYICKDRSEAIKYIKLLSKEKNLRKNKNPDL